MFVSHAGFGELSPMRPNDMQYTLDVVVKYPMPSGVSVSTMTRLPSMANLLSRVTSDPKSSMEYSLMHSS